MLKSTYKSIALAAVIGTVCSAGAQRISAPQDKTIVPDSYAIVGPNNELLTPWIPVVKEEGGVTPQVYNWDIGYDSAAFNLGTNAPFTNIYGPAAGSRQEAFPTPTGIGFSTGTATGAVAHYDAPWTINDASFKPSSRGKATDRWFWNTRWNPAGTWPTGSGTATLITIVRFWQGPAVNRRVNIYGIAFQSTNLAAGSYNNSYTPSGTLAHADLPMSMPYEDGWIEVVYGTLNGANQIVQLPAPGKVSGRYYPMNSPTWPYTPGTNACDSTPGFYVDDSTSGTPYFRTTTDPTKNVSNWTMTYAEEQVPGTGADAYDTGSLLLEPTYMFGIDNDAVYIHGHLVFADHENTDTTLRPVIAAPILMHRTGDATINNRTRNVFINRLTGEFWAMVPHNTGIGTGWVADTYDILVGDGFDYDAHTYKHWLRKRLSGIVVGGTSVDVGTITLVNGDCNGDNEVNLVDLGMISALFGLANGDPGFDKEVDLNHDDEINLVDFGICAAAFGVAGDE